MANETEGVGEVHISAVPSPTVATEARGLPKFAVDGLALTTVRNGVARFYAYRDDVVPQNPGEPAVLTREYTCQLDLDLPTLVSLRVFLEQFVDDLIKKEMYLREALDHQLNLPNPFEVTNG